MPQSVQPVVLTEEAIQSTPSESFPSAAESGDVTWRTLLSSSKTPSNTFASGIARCAAKGGYLKCHRHTHAEIYYVIQGRGVVTIDGEEFKVGKGSVVFIPGDAEHGIRNEDEDEDLEWLYVFAADDFGEVVYRFADGSKETEV